MLETKIFNIPFSDNLTKDVIENFFREKNIDTVKWAIVKVSGKSAEVLTTFMKKK